ncbi:bifunctional metallophosphatase/5'-nucleotidase [Clavibacter michiganensis]|uniref:bifunctional metallophosphatase/5'-nucleotidase n=1 Tax=Clavibacter michiganensis TaxID=28447 RepID=UPI0026DAFAF3|nr:bifunctional UDP-sugar hydrolase/5'-nucleotidase [Clavibacter michiganensis]MDO4029008.1 bifunctional UDP-sugar hydrolase/5'-nucleotidase [Clavibacter michiganensis]
MRSAPTRRPPGAARSGALALVAGLSATALLGLGATPASAAEGDVAIDVYSINDFHGRLETTSSTAGAAVISGAFQQAKAENPNSTLISAGDNIGASTFTSLSQQDEPTLDALNAMGVSVSTLGNHEFDQGRDDVDGRVVPASDFPYISANLYEKGTKEHAYAAYDVQDIDGVRVAFVGATTEALPELVSPAGIATLDVGSVVDASTATARALRDGDDANGEADVVVLVVHEGASTSDESSLTDDSVFGRIVTGVQADVDAVISGHTHRGYDYELPVAGKALPLPVLQTGSYGTNLGHLSLTVDPATKALTSISSELVPLLTADGKPAFPADPAVQRIVDAAVAKAEVIGSRTVGEITGDITRARQTDGEENRGGESTIGNLVADAQLWATRADLGTEIAFMNPGGIRQDLTVASSGAGDAEGEVTYKEAAIVQPFANTLTTAKITGAGVKAVLEQQWQPEGSSRPFLKLGLSRDLTYTYDPTAARGERITGVFFQGEPVDPARVFTMVANSFLAEGGDNFTELANTTEQSDSGRVDLTAFVDHITEFSPVDPDSATRSIGIVDTTGAAPAAGQERSYELSSLLVSNAPVQDTEVVTLIDGEEVARTPIDAAVVDTTDEQGRASVRFTVPAGLTAGAHQLAFLLPSTGASVLYALDTSAGSVVPSGTGTVPAPSSEPTLAATGSESGPVLGTSLAALALGLALVAFRRRASAAARR